MTNLNTAQKGKEDMLKIALLVRPLRPHGNKVLSVVELSVLFHIKPLLYV